MFIFGRPKMAAATPAELQERLASGDKVTVIDVRDDWEYREGHIPGSLHRPLGQISTWASEFQKDQEIYLICRSGARSASAYQYLASQGFTNLKNVTGGIIAWRGPVER